MNARSAAEALRDRLINGSCSHGGNFLAPALCDDCELDLIEQALAVAHARGVQELVDAQRERPTP